MTTSEKYPGRSAVDLAAQWKVTDRTIRRWRAAGVPVENVAAMIAWAAGLPSDKQAKLSVDFRRRLTELRMEHERHTGASASSDPYYTEFLASKMTTGEEANARDVAGHASDTDYLDALKQRRDYALFKLKHAQARNDLTAADDAGRLLKLVAPIIHDEELRAQKLGRELGDFISKPDYERQIRAIAYWLVRAIDVAEAQLAPSLATRSAAGPLFREEVRGMLEPVLLAHFFIEPLRRAANLPHDAGGALPPWVLAAMRSAIAACVDDPEAMAAEFNPAPVPPE